MAEADKNVPEMELSMGSASREDLATQNEEKDEPTILEKYVQPCLAELLGSTLFFSVGCLSVLINPHGAGPLMPALAHGFTLAALISVLGNISGGHFNPVISLAVVISGGLTPVLLVPYWICQLSGGILGALLAKGLADEASFVNRTGAACMVDSGSSVVRAVGVEMSLTCLLILTVLMGALGDRSKTPLAPFSIAFTLVAGILAGGSISGSCLNPARALGPAVVSYYWDDHWVYWIGPASGAVMMSIIYRFLLAGRSHRLFLK